MNQLLNKMKQLPQNFWVYNFLFGLLFMVLLRDYSFITLILFPVNLALLANIVETLPNIDSMYSRFIGVYPVLTDAQTLIGRALVGLLVWAASIGLTIALVIINFLIKER